MFVHVCFGTRLGVSLAAPKGVSKRIVFKMASSLNFEKLASLYLFVVVPVWFPPRNECLLALQAGNWGPTTPAMLQKDKLFWGTLLCSHRVLQPKLARLEQICCAGS